MIANIPEGKLFVCFASFAFSNANVRPAATFQMSNFNGFMPGASTWAEHSSDIFCANAPSKLFTLRYYTWQNLSRLAKSHPQASGFANLALFCYSSFCLQACKNVCDRLGEDPGYRGDNWVLLCHLLNRPVFDHEFGLFRSSQPFQVRVVGTMADMKSWIW